MRLATQPCVLCFLHQAVVDRIDVSNWRRIGFPEYMLVQVWEYTARFLLLSIAASLVSLVSLVSL